MEQPIEQEIEQAIEKPIESRLPATRFYTEEEVKAILARAVNAHGTTFTRQHLEDMAAELGVSDERLQAAEESWMTERLEKEEREAFITHRRRQALKGIVGVTTSAIIAYLAYISGFGVFEVLGGIAGLLIFFAALGVASDLYEAYFTTEGEEFEDEYDLWLEEKQKLRLRAETRRQKMLGRLEDS